jgi:hypothetical protein
MAARRAEETAGHELYLMSDDLKADDGTFAPARRWGLKLASGGRPLELDFRIPRAQSARQSEFTTCTVEDITHLWGVLLRNDH